MKLSLTDGARCSHVVQIGIVYRENLNPARAKCKQTNPRKGSHANLRGLGICTASPQKEKCEPSEQMQRLSGQFTT